MRFMVCCTFLAIVAIAAAATIPASSVEEPQSLYDEDGPSHDNVGERQARQFGYGGLGGGFIGVGGVRGGYYGGYRGGYGGFRGGYGGFRGGYGGYRRYGGYGGYRGGFYG